MRSDDDACTAHTVAEKRLKCVFKLSAMNVSLALPRDLPVVDFAVRTQNAQHFHDSQAKSSCKNGVCVSGGVFRFPEEKKEQAEMGSSARQPYKYMFMYTFVSSPSRCRTRKFKFIDIMTNYNCVNIHIFHLAWLSDWRPLPALLATDFSRFAHFEHFSVVFYCAFTAARVSVRPCVCDARVLVPMPRHRMPQAVGRECTRGHQARGRTM